MTGASSPSSGSPDWPSVAPATATTSALAEARASEIFSRPASFSARVLRALSWVTALAAVSTACGSPVSNPHSESVKPHVAYSGSSVTDGVPSRPAYCPQNLTPDPAGQTSRPQARRDGVGAVGPEPAGPARRHGGQIG